MMSLDYMIVAVRLNEQCEALNQINDTYIRHNGSMMMASPDMEDQIEDLLHEMDDSIEKLSKATDADLSVFTDDVPGYRDFIDRVKEVVAANHDEVTKAREFLSRYIVK